MSKKGLQRTFRRPHLTALAAFFLVLFVTSPPAFARHSRRHASYARLNSFGILIAYSNDSSHMLLGDAERRKLLELGGSYNRRLWLGRAVDWQYSAELLPVALESDPLSLFINKQTAPTAVTTVRTGSPPVLCSSFTEGYSFPGANGQTYSGTATVSCHGRRWSMGEAVSPLGMQWNFRPSRKLQPLLDWHGGYMYSSKQIPVDSAGSFNFTFDIGFGLELYRTPSHSVRLEYRYHHISNDNTAVRNPGIDNGLFQVTYSFGR